MAWYKKQLMAKLKNSEEKKSETKKGESTKSSRPSFGPRKINAGRISPNPVAARNINRPKTDKP